MTILATTKYPLTFVSREYFNMHFIFVVIDNCATVMVLNNRELFCKDLRRVKCIGIVTVHGEDYYLIHKGTAILS